MFLGQPPPCWYFTILQHLSSLLWQFLYFWHKTAYTKNLSRCVNDISPSSISTFLFKCFCHFSVAHDCWKQVWPNKIFNCLPWSSRNLVLLQKRPALFSECEGSCKACLVRMFYSKMKMLCLWMQMYFWTSLLSTQKVTFQVKRSNRIYMSAFTG